MKSSKVSPVDFGKRVDEGKAGPEVGNWDELPEHLLEYILSLLKDDKSDPRSQTVRHGGSFWW